MGCLIVCRLLCVDYLSCGFLGGWHILIVFAVLLLLLGVESRLFCSFATCCWFGN